MCPPLLFGTAQVAGAFGGVGAGATAGLIGYGGVPFASGALLGMGSGLGTVMQLGGAATNLYGMQQQSNLMQANLMRQAEIREYDAKVRENNALMAEWSSQAKADTFQRRLAVLKGKQSPKTAKSGVVINQDSPLLVATDTAAEGQLEYLNIINQGTVLAAAERAGAAGKRSAAEQSRINASLVQPATNVAMAGEVLGTGYSLLRNA
tara:strand:+ start:3861 stop:4481 length:621 start_codon:yes stop_codon:yes gene_type:complete